MLTLTALGRVLLCPQLAGHAAFGAAWREMCWAGDSQLPFVRKQVRRAAL